MSRFLLGIPYPPAQGRSYHNALREDAVAGFIEFNFENTSGGRATGAQTCGDCHRPTSWLATTFR